MHRRKPTTPSRAPRSALKEAIAARKKAQMPSRPESAQAYPEARPSEPAPRPATRTVPTGAPPVLSVFCPSDPYARRPDSRAATSSKQVSSPRSVRSKASTPSSKPINAPRLRPHEPTQTGTTRSKPKRLDLSKSKSHGDLNAASRSRSRSTNERLAGQALKSSNAGQHGEFEEDAPAPIVLESPPLSASQPSHISHAPMDSHRTVTPVPALEPERMSLEEPSTGPVSPERERQPSTPPRHSDVPAPESATKSQPDEMVIYEDPATPVTAHEETPPIDPVEHLTPTQSPQRWRQEMADHTAATPVESTTPAKAPAPEMTPRRGLAADGTNEPHFQSPVRRTPLRGSPSPSRNRPLGTPLEHGAREPSLPEPAGNDIQMSPNNENATAHATKPTDYPATPRSAAKPGALEEVPLNESVLRVADARPSAYFPEEPRRSRKWAERHRSPSPRSKDPVNAKEMLPKALSRIASKNMDISGYRKLQGLFQYHGPEIVARDDDYYAVLEALLNELESAPLSRKDHDVKTQILATIRSMLLRTSELFHRFDIPAMAALIRARRHYESSSHFVACLEEVAELLSSLIPITTSISGVLQGMEFGDESGTEESSRSIIMGFSTINHVLSQGPVEISDEVLASVGSALSQHLGHPRPGVRKQATELCTLLNLKFGLDRVQKVTPPAGEGSLNLLTYFMARRSQ
ncbi:Protein stu1 [Penicillium chermesinum]|nr:Protein stu1 [Penicillium chermesinum]